VKMLSKASIRSEAIHGNKSQNARQRALGNFKTGRSRVLVATDIAARGIDIDDLSLVVNYDLPNIPETYVHRIGRTGRAAASGVALSFCDVEEQPFLKDIQKLIGQKINVVEEHPFVDFGAGDSITASNSNHNAGASSRRNRNQHQQGRDSGRPRRNGHSGQRNNRQRYRS